MAEPTNDGQRCQHRNNVLRKPRPHKRRRERNGEEFHSLLGGRTAAVHCPEESNFGERHGIIHGRRCDQMLSQKTCNAIADEHGGGEIHDALDQKNQPRDCQQLRFQVHNRRSHSARPLTQKALILRPYQSSRHVNAPRA